MLKQDQRLGIENLGPLHHRKCLIEAKLHDFNILSFVVIASSGRDLVGVLVLRQKEKQPLRNRARAHIQLEELLWRSDSKPGFFHDFPADSLLGLVGVKKAGTGLQ